MQRDTVNLRVTAERTASRSATETNDGEITDDDGTPLPSPELELALDPTDTREPLTAPPRLAHPRLVPRSWLAQHAGQVRTRFARASSPLPTPDPDAPVFLPSRQPDPVNAPMFLSVSRKRTLPPPLRYRPPPAPVRPATVREDEDFVDDDKTQPVDD